MFSALKLVAGSAAFALVVGLLAVSVLDVSQDEEPADVVSPTPTYTFEAIGPAVEDGSPRAIAQLDDVILVSAEDDSEALSMWSSADAGDTWTQTPFEQYVGRLVAFGGSGDRPGVFVALGEGNTGESRSERPRLADQIWVSSDGIDWENVASLENADVHELSVIDGRLVAVGMEHRPEDMAGTFPRGTPTMWTSEDGTTWDATEIASVQDDHPTFSSGDALIPFFLYPPVVSADGTWLVRGWYQGEDDTDVLWRSTDGVTHGKT